MSGPPLIVTVIEHYHPGWEAPSDNGREWVQCLCPWHGDTTPSAAVSYRLNAYNCLACGVRGDAIGLIRREEGMTYKQALERATELSPEGVAALPPGAGRKPGRGAPGGARSHRAGYRRGGDQVSPRLRGRAATWS